MKNIITFSSKINDQHLALEIEKLIPLPFIFKKTKINLDNIINKKIDCILFKSKQNFREKKIDFFVIKNLFIYFHIENKTLNQVKQLFIPPVSFIGSGPGKKNWLTLEAFELLQLGDICFYDALVSEEILNVIPQKTMLYYVGKRGDSNSFNQDKINQLISDYARIGKKVIRLKGGDCGILGRITEELNQLRKYSIAYTITPGLTALQSLPSEIGLFPTQRHISDGFITTTARQTGGKVNKLNNRINSTLIIYMGILRLDELVKQLLNDSYSEDLPIAIALNLTHKNRQIIYGTLKTIVNKTKPKNLRPPGLIICGKVVNKKLIFLPPIFPQLNKRYLIYSDNFEKKLQNELLFWGAYAIKVSSKIPQNLSNFNKIISLKKLCPKDKIRIKEQKISFSTETNINKLNLEIFQNFLLK